MHIQFALATVVAVLGGAWSQFWWIGVTSFLLYVLIWFITISRHEILVSKIATNIDELMRVKTKKIISTEIGEAT